MKKFATITMDSLLIVRDFFILDTNSPPCDGGDSCCGANGYKCGEGEGDCDSNNDCKPGLTCGSNNCVGASFDSFDDCCEGM